MAVVESGPTQVQQVLAKGSIADPFPSLELRYFPGSYSFNRLVCIWYCAHNLFIQDAYTARGDRTGSQFFKTRNTELAHDENIQRSTQPFCNFVRNRHAAARQSEHNHIFTTCVFIKLLR